MPHETQRATGSESGTWGTAGRNRTAATSVEELRRQHAEMERFFDMALDMICVVGTEGYFKKLNAAWEKTLGFTKAELLARPFLEFVHPDDREGTRAELEKVRQGVDVIFFENRLLHRDGSYRWLSWKAPAIPPEQDFLYATARDVTENKRADEELRGSQTRLKLALDAAEIGGWELNLETEQASRSPKHDQIFGYAGVQQEWTYATFLAHVHPEDRERVDGKFRGCVASGGNSYFECRIIRSDGAERHIWVRASVYPDEAGRPMRMLGMVRDITDRKRTEMDLHDREARMRAVLENAVEGIITIDERGTIESANVATEKTFGYTLAELVGSNVSMLMPAPYRPQHVAGLANYLRTGEAKIIGRGCEVIGLRKDGSVFPMELTVSEVRIEGRRLFTGFVRDITERKHAEESLARLGAEAIQRAAQLESANKEMEAFSYSVSHDLRAPLRHVQGYVELLKKAVGDQLPEKAVRYLAVIADAGRQMGQLIDDLLAFSRIGRTEMQREMVNLDELVQGCLLSLESQIRDRNILWRIAPLPAVTGDRAMLRQVFANLIGNSVKYTGPRERAEIEIGLGPREAGAVTIFIRDNGVGFDMQFADKLFGVFQRLHTSSEFEGTGIGLANVRRIITRHGGRVWPQAEVGKGATFFFTLEEAGAAPHDAAGL